MGVDGSFRSSVPDFWGLQKDFWLRLGCLVRMGCLALGRSRSPPRHAGVGAVSQPIRKSPLKNKQVCSVASQVMVRLVRDSVSTDGVGSGLAPLPTQGMVRRNRSMFRKYRLACSQAASLEIRNGFAAIAGT